METLFRLISGATAAAAAFLLPVAPLLAAAVAFVAADFLSGIAASRAESRRRGRQWRFERRLAWRTVVKLGFVAAAVVMAHTIDCCMPDFMNIQFARLFTGFTCGVELWSFLENAAVVSRAPLFRRLGVYVDNKLKRYEDKQRNSES